MVVALGAGEPLDGSDQVTRVGRINPDVGLGVVLDQDGRARREPRVAADLGGVRSERPRILTRGRARGRAGGFPGEAVVWEAAGGVWDLRPVAAGLRGRVDVLHPIDPETPRIRGIRLGPGRGGRPRSE